MTIPRRRLRLFIGIALVAMFGLALGPVVSRVLAGTGGFNPWAEICSASSPGGPNQPGPGDAAHLEHCPLCGGQASLAMAPPPAGPAPWRAATGADHLPALFRLAPKPLHAWAAARPRGPPAST